MKQWGIAPAPDGSAHELARQVRIPVPLAGILLSRGITSGAEADRFLNPRLSDACDPFRLPNMDVAVDRIWRAIGEGERIAVFGDYDVDGVTSTALMSQVLSRLGGRVSCHLPNRMEDGYGLSLDSVERCIREARPGLIITTDCGTGSHEAVAAAKTAGVDIVVTDHHEVSRGTVAAVAVVNPKLGVDASSRLLAGVGVAFKVCHAVLKRGRERRRKHAADLDLREYLDLVALGTVADVVPLLHENRILVRHGLAQINRGRRLGLKALAQTAGVKGDQGTYHLGFILGPRINAAGRLGKADEALELLLTEDVDKAGVIAAHLDSANQERKSIEADILEIAMKQIAARHDPAIHYGIVVGETGWHIGVVGIVASRLASHYGRPAIVVGFDDQGRGRGSCRSIEGFDLLSGLESCRSHLARFGGHEMAAGLEVSMECFDLFREAFLRVCSEKLKGRDLNRMLPIDGWVTLQEVMDPAFGMIMSRMEPFGEGNAEPVWGVRNVQVFGSPIRVGKTHVKFRVGMGAQSCEAIGFNMAERLSDFPEGPLDIAFMLRSNTYLGRTTPQLHLKDFRAASKTTV